MEFSTSIQATFTLTAGTLTTPLGVVYRDESRTTFDTRVDELAEKAGSRTVQEMVDSYAI